MRNFISYSEYLARHPTEYGGIDPEQTCEPRISSGRGRPLPVRGQFVSPEESDAELCPREPAVEVSRTQREESGRGGRTAPREKGGAFSVCVMLLCFAIAVASAVLMSEGLGLGHLRGEVTRCTTESHKAYCVQVAAPAEADAAAAVARDLRTRGGGGYIWIEDGVYLVLASAYTEESECDGVLENLVVQKVTATKFVVAIPSVSLDFSADAATAETICRAYDSLWDTYRLLYDLSVALDCDEATPDGVRTRIGTRNAELRAVQDELDRVSDRCADIAYVRIKAELTGLSSQLETIFVDMDHDEDLSADLKYAYLRLLHAQAALAAELS